MRYSSKDNISIWGLGTVDSKLSNKISYGGNIFEIYTGQECFKLIEIYRYIPIYRYIQVLPLFNAALLHTSIISSII